MPKPENPNTWSRLTRDDKRRFQFKPGHSAPGLEERVVNLQSHISLPEYKGPNPNIPHVIVKRAYTSGDSYVKYLNSIDTELTRVDTIERRGRKSGFKVVYNEHPSLPRDYFAKKYGPLSLDDLASNPKQLSRENLRDIFTFWIALGWKSSLNNKDRSKIGAIYGLVGNFITGADNSLRSNWRIQEVRGSLLASLRFYREHLLNFSSDEDIDFLVKSFPDHIDTLALIYSFETSGLSLSSIQKILIQRRQQLEKDGKISIYKRLLLKTVGSLTSQAIADIKKYKSLNTTWDHLFYEPKLDRPVEEILESNYDFANLPKDGLGKDYEKTQQLIDSWLEYRARINTRLSADPIDIITDEHPYISNIRLMARTKESTHFVLFFKTSGLYLTLDIDSKGRLFGLPPDLAVRFPHADSTIFGDVLSTLIPKLEKMFPDAAEAIRRKSERKAERVIFQSKKSPISPAEIQSSSPIAKIKPEVVVPPSKPPKKKALRRESYVGESQFSPELESEVSVTHPIRIVDYSADLVLKLAGKKTPQKEVVQLMRTIRRFEFGNVDAKPLDPAEFGMAGAGAILQSLTIGKRRVVFKHHGNSMYSILSIANRDHVYKRLTS